MSTKKITYIFPVYNNEGCIEELYRQMQETVIKPLAQKYTYEIIFINDGSRDRSYEYMQKVAKKDKQVKVLSLSRNFGHQAAVSAGLDRSTGDAVIIMDSDLQDPPEVCPKLIKKWEEGYDVVYAQRRSRQDSFIKKFTADTYYRVLSMLSSVDIPRNTGDFRLVDRKVVDVVCNMREYHRFLRGMYSFAGFKQAPVLFDRHARQGGGKSEYSIKKMVKLAKDGIFGFSDTPLRFITRLGILLTVIALVVGAVLLIAALFFGATITGLALIALLVTFLGGVQLLMLGVMGEYVARIHSEVRGRPVYIIAEEVNTDAK